MEEIELRVAEAEIRDVGKAIARIDPDDMKLCGIDVADIVEIQGARRTVALAALTHQDKRGKGVIQIDEITRKNAGIEIEDQVKIRKISCDDAQLVILAPRNDLQKPIPTETVKKSLENIPLMEGCVVRIYQNLEFIAEKIEPKDRAVIIKPKTEIRVRGQPQGKRSTGACYKDVGGLSKEIQRLKEMIELPIKYPEIFERMGIEAPKGVLLHGPSGCGKTLLARAVAYETDAEFIPVSGPEVIHKFYGESEANLRKIFEAAQKNAPSIIFFDEFDAIGTKRDKVLGEVEKRVTAQLLSLMDGLKERGQVIVIAATNAPELLDPALRRPGRFDREIIIPVPDIDGRKEILEIHTRGMPLAKDVSINELVKITNGFSGADLEALCREAAMNMLRKVFFPKIDYDLEKIPYEKIIGLEINLFNFQEAIKEVGPSLIRETFVKIPDVRWEDIGGLEDIKQVIQDNIEYPIQYPDLFKYLKNFNIIPPKGILLHGPPGTGKTLLVKALATESKSNLISIKGPELMVKWVGETEKGIREIFKKARQTSPCIVFFDEIDSFAPQRGQDSSGVPDRAVAQLQTEMDGIEELQGVVVVAATNRLDLLDSALLRSGRFDFHLEVPVPERAEKLKIFEIHSRGKPLTKDVDFEKLIDILGEGATGADIESLYKKASMLAVRDFIKTAKDIKDKKGFCIKMSHFEEVLKSANSFENGKEKFRREVKEDF